MLSVKELKSMTRKELLKALNQARQHVQKARLTLKTGHEKNTSLSRKWKKQTAQILTFLNELMPASPSKETASEKVISKEGSEEKKTKKEVEKKAA